MLLPIYLNMKDRKVVAIGGGRVIVRKLRNLIDNMDDIIVIAPDADAQIEEWHRQKKIKWIQRDFRDSDIEAGNIVFCGTDNNGLNHRIAVYCSEKGAWCNQASDAEDGDFILPATWAMGPILFSLTTGNSSPRLLKLIKEDMLDQYEELGIVAEDLAELRRRLKEALSDSKEREAFWRQHLPADTINKIKSGKWQEMKEEMENEISRIGAKS